ncbi:hypothetical protein CC80DRAFT_45476 [Byssothecium circinans]|uniref:Uncharacterized protein n=1 Tax=Byssothecium circinans TaxID=147558 RepID=A0A6A5U0K7_9PLEO|nr:hypothetical protein CC80DRAFT_45476 [Byssothecium circinans]
MVTIHPRFFVLVFWRHVGACAACGDIHWYNWLFEYSIIWIRVCVCVCVCVCVRVFFWAGRVCGSGFFLGRQFPFFCYSFVLCCVVVVLPSLVCFYAGELVTCVVYRVFGFLCEDRIVQGVNVVLFKVSVIAVGRFVFTFTFTLST